ncbi:hypothetical protein KGY58_05740 [Candidatus Bipolaricaulota bacterium]|nr:hypothetical protein [Candidatus Bipolaricaulota bacterium]
MNKREINFIKGHMGGNEIILVYGSDIQSKLSPEEAISVLNPPHIRGDQIGLLSSSEETDLGVTILDRSYEDYLDMCGGLTQVLGHALVETNLGSYFDIDLHEGLIKITLKTDLGNIPIKISVKNERVARVETGMAPFVQHSYRLGVEKLSLNGMSVTKAGDFLVIEAKELENAFPGVKLDSLDQKAVNALQSAQKQFDQLGVMSKENADFAVYDKRSETCDGRLIFPHQVSTGHIEPACGTGTVAVGIAMVHNNQVEDSSELEFEAGGEPDGIGGPERTRLNLTIEKGDIVDAYFSHSLVEILASGNLWT